MAVTIHIPLPHAGVALNHDVPLPEERLRVFSYRDATAARQKSGWAAGGKSLGVFPYRDGEKKGFRAFVLNWKIGSKLAVTDNFAPSQQNHRIEIPFKSIDGAIRSCRAVERRANGNTPSLFLFLIFSAVATVFVSLSRSDTEHSFNLQAHAAICIDYSIDYTRGQLGSSEFQRCFLGRLSASVSLGVNSGDALATNDYRQRTAESEIAVDNQFAP